MRVPLAFPLFAGLFLTPVLGAQDFAESFDGGSNVGGWSAGGSELIQTTGGHPGAYLESALDSSAPTLRTTLPGSPFTGDLRSQGVRSLGIDLRIQAPSAVFPNWRELTLILGREQGIPGQWFDDQLVAVRADLIPRPGQGWHRYDLWVPSAETVLPASWFCPGGSVDPDAQWNQVITDVAWVMFYFGQPEQPYFVPYAWLIDIDNPRVAGSLPVNTYCVGKPSSQGCLARIEYEGSPSAAEPTVFQIAAQPVPGQTVGAFVYGLAPQYSWFNHLDLPCIAGPLSKATLLWSGGRAGPCPGSLALDFNSYIQSGVDPALQAGNEVFGQFWFRDAQKPSGGSLSDAIGFTIQP